MNPRPKSIITKSSKGTKHYYVNQGWTFMLYPNAIHFYEDVNEDRIWVEIFYSDVDYIQFIF